jgi:hypothetical protein
VQPESFARSINLTSVGCNQMVVNLRSAKALGVTVPQSILLRVDEVIE